MSDEIIKAKDFIENKECKKALDLAKKMHRKDRINDYLEILDLLIAEKYLPAFEEKGQYYLYFDENHDNEDYGEKYFNQYLEIQPHSINLMCSKAMALSYKDLNKSIKLMDKALKSYDNFSEDEKPRITEEDIWMGKIELLVKKNDKKETLAELNNFEKEYPDNPKMILYKGILLSETGEDENALKYLETSLKRDNTILALNAKGNALYNLRRYNEALAVYNKCISHEKEVDDLDIKTNFNSKAAFSAIELENYNEAIKYLNKTITMLNEHGRLKNDLEKIYRQCSFEKERLLKQYNIQDRKFSRFKFLSSKTALIVLILFIIGYFILTYLGY